jgi:hypothetical protein
VISIIISLTHYFFFFVYCSKRTHVRTITRTRHMPMESRRRSEPSMFPHEAWTPSFWEIKSLPRNTITPSEFTMSKHGYSNGIMW